MRKTMIFSAVLMAWSGMAISQSNPLAPYSAAQKAEWLAAETKAARKSASTIPSGGLKVHRDPKSGKVVLECTHAAHGRTPATGVTHEK